MSVSVSISICISISICMGPESSGRLSLFTIYSGAYLTVCLCLCLCLYLYLYLSISVWAQNQVVGYRYLPSIVALI